MAYNASTNIEQKEKGQILLGLIAGSLIILSAFLPMRLNPNNLPDSKEVVAPLAVRVMDGKASPGGKKLLSIVLGVGIVEIGFTLLARLSKSQFIWVIKTLFSSLGVLFFLFFFYEIHIDNYRIVHVTFSGTSTFGPYWTGPAAYAGLLGSLLSTYLSIFARDDW